eukprot:TRINITY_DN506_c0_g1_i1.p1 TRINITY_DN506_c0_g1~~TRINITY_DN506_c0_g1_i1.p1  ORF type:complete len:249 (-),score=73.95 TRINITY_DN506_c0_g1_i1:538-1284(-)
MSSSDSGSGSGSGEPSDVCKVLGGVFADLVQLVLGCVAVCSLTLKRVREKPRRPWRTFCLDASKNAAAALLAHFTGMAVAIGVAHVSGSGDQCAWYFVAYLYDVTVGTTLSYALLRSTGLVAAALAIDALVQGDYGEPFAWERFAAQLAVWCGCVVAARAADALVLFALRGTLAPACLFVAMPFAGHPRLFLVTVMVLCPVVLNAAQMWLSDHFLKAHQAQQPQQPQRPEGSVEEGSPLLPPVVPSAL